MFEIIVIILLIYFIYSTEHNAAIISRNQEKIEKKILLLKDQGKDIKDV